MTAQEELLFVAKMKDEVSATTKQIATNVKKDTAAASKSFEGFGNAAKIAGLAVAGMAVGAVAMGISFAKMAAEEQVGMARLEQAIENTGTNWDGMTAIVEANIAAMEKSTAFSDGEMRDALSILVTELGDVDSAFNVMSVAQDLARGTGMDLMAASKLLGKATDENVNVLKKYGVTMKEGATATDLLAEVQKRFGGQSAAYAKTAAGQWEIFNNTLDNLKEDIGSALLPAFTELATGAVKAIEAIRNGPLPGMMATAGKVKDVILELLGVITGTAPDAGAALTEAMGAPKAKEIMKAVAQVRDAVVEVVDFLTTYVIPPLSAAVQFVASNWEVIGPVISNAINQITGPVRGFIQLLQGAANLVQQISSARISLPNLDLPHFDRGGTVPGPEGSPQLIVAHAGEKILNRAQQSGQGGGGLTVVVQVEGNVIGVPDLQRLIVSAVREGVQRGGFVGVIPPVVGP